ncbi:MAG: polyphosphate kinase 1, partial [Ruthenibacterium sp.]
MFDHDIDYRVVMSELLKKRRKLAAVRLQTSPHAPQNIVAFLCEKLLLPQTQVVEQFAPLDLSVGFKVASRLSADGHNALFYPVRRPIQASRTFRLSQAVQQRDILIEYPYQSIRPFILLLHEAANDP